MRILLVDDDEILRQSLMGLLKSQHYTVDAVSDGKLGWDYAQSVNYDLIILDVNLPRIDGVSLCKKLRSNHYLGPILLLTAKGESSDKVSGLDAGADDYIVKPCTLEEFLARIRAVLRRSSLVSTPLLEWGELQMDPSTCEVSIGGEPLMLSPKEYGLLELFLRSPKRIFCSSVILEHLWGFDDTPGEETVRSHIKRLRRKLKAAGIENMIETVYGMGYRLQSPTESSASEGATVSPADQARTAAISLWDKFKPSIQERLSYVEQAIAALEQGMLSENQRQAAIENAHKLAGSLGMFGFSNGSQLSKTLEQILRSSMTDYDIDSLRRLTVGLAQEIQRSPQHQETLSSSTSATVLENYSGLAGEDTSNTKVSLPAESTTIKVIALDDDSAILATLQQILSAWGIHLVPLNTPIDLWDALDREIPDLVILDIDMPQGNGIELCHLIRNHDAWSGLPILFLTAHRDPAVIVQLYSAGADDYIAKPFTEPELVTRILNRIKRYQLFQDWKKPSSKSDC